MQVLYIRVYKYYNQYNTQKDNTAKKTIEILYIYNNIFIKQKLGTLYLLNYFLTKNIFNVAQKFCYFKN